jgi:hypothetical protein
VAVSAEEEALPKVVSPVNVLSPANVWVVVETTPRDVAPALGITIECVVPLETTVTSLPDELAVKN